MRLSLALITFAGDDLRSALGTFRSPDMASQCLPLSPAPKTARLIFNRRRYPESIAM
jgi:hypothetical protein